MSDTKKIKEYISEYGIFYIVFITIFAVQLMTMFNDGANPGNWRYLLHISPIAAVFAVIGINNLAKPEFRKTSYIISGILAFITLAFLSKQPTVLYCRMSAIILNSSLLFYRFY